MDVPHYIDSVFASLKNQGDICRLDTGDLLIVDPESARHIEDQNYLDEPVPGRFVESEEGGPLWRHVKKELRDISSRQNNPQVLRALMDSLHSALLTNGANTTDLTKHVALTISRALVPLIADGLNHREHGLIVKDQEVKILRFINLSEKSETLRGTLYRAWTEFRAGRAVSAHLRKRRSGALPPQCDSAQAIVDFGDRLTKAQAAYALMTVFTAAAGAPGTVSACLAFEMVRQDACFEKLRAEHQNLDNDTYLASPIRSAPYTYCFVREVLRMWSFPIFTTRMSKTDVSLKSEALRKDELYHLSSYFTHHNEAYWKHADQFEPDRWLNGEAGKKYFVPFGWSARACPGANSGLLQLMILARLLTVDLRIELDPSFRPIMALEGTPLPRDFIGRIVSR